MANITRYDPFGDLVDDFFRGLSYDRRDFRLKRRYAA